MTRRALALVVLVTLASPALAGCVERLAVSGATSDGVHLLEVSAVTAPIGEALRWTGPVLVAVEDPYAGYSSPSCPFGGCREPPVSECLEQNCARFAFEVRVPDGYWESRNGGLEVSVVWPPTMTWPSLELTVLDAEGREVARGATAAFASVAILERATSGRYEAVVVATHGRTGFDGIVQVEARDAATPPRELLPDLVTLPPTDLRIDGPNDWVCTPVIPVYCQFVATKWPLLQAGVKGCKAYETALSESRRCLRFSNYFGNAGEGPLDVLLRLEGPLALSSGENVQRVHLTDGSVREVPVGRASYHLAHGHYHLDGVVGFAVHRFDLESGERGEAVREWRKTGLCLGDWGLVELGLPGTTPPYEGSTCYEAEEAVAGGEWAMVVSPGWYDLYGWFLEDNYVEITGLEDGVYELVSVADGDGLLVESDDSNNEGSTVFRLLGDRVEVVGPRIGARTSGAP